MSFGTMTWPSAVDTQARRRKTPTDRLRIGQRIGLTPKGSLPSESESGGLARTFSAAGVRWPRYAKSVPLPAEAIRVSSVRSAPQWDLKLSGNRRPMERCAECADRLYGPPPPDECQVVG